MATGEATPALGVVSAGVDQVMRVLWLLFTLSLFPPSCEIVRFWARYIRAGADGNWKACVLGCCQCKGRSDGHLGEVAQVVGWAEEGGAAAAA